MDILTYIDRVKANYSKQPEPVYNTKKYFIGTDNVDDIGPGSFNRGKLPRLNVMPENYNSEGRGTGVMIDPKGLQDGKIPLPPTQGLNEGGIATPKRGLVDEPGSYGGNKRVGGEVKKVHAKLKKKLKRNPTMQEMKNKGNFSYNGVIRNLDNLTLYKTEKKSEAATKAASELAKKKRKIFDETIGKSLLKELKKRSKYIPGNEFKEAVKEGKILNNEQLAKKYKIALSTLERAIAKLRKENKLDPPKQTYEGREEQLRKREVIRQKNIKKISSRSNEKKIKDAVKIFDPNVLADELDLAHRASLKANAALNLDYLVTSLGLDAKVVNQSLIQSTEQKLGKLYLDQQKLIKGLKPGKIPKEIQKKIEKLNITISELSDRTKGALQGVLIDEKTLKPSIYGIDYKKVFGAGLIDDDVTVKNLTPEQIEIGKLNIPNQIEYAKNEVKPGTPFHTALMDYCGKGKKAGGSAGVCSIEEATDGLKNALTKSKGNPAQMSKFKNILKTGGKFFGWVDAPIELTFALPGLLKGDKDEALRATTLGLFGAGRSELEKLDPKSPAYKTAKGKQDVNDYVKKYSEAKNLEKFLDKTKDFSSNTKVQENRKKVNERFNTLVEDINKIQSQYVPFTLQDEVTANKQIRDQEKKEADKGFEQPDGSLATSNYAKDLDLSNAYDYFKYKGDPGYNRNKVAVEELGLDNFYGDFTGKELEDRYSDLPTNIASSVGTAEKKQTDELMRKKLLEKGLDLSDNRISKYGIRALKGTADFLGFATGGLANLTTKTAPKKGPQSQGLAYFMKRGRK